MLRKSSGMSLIEIMVAMAIMGIMMIAMVTMQDNQQRTNNFLAFQLKKMQLENAIMSQVLSKPFNCSCLFTGSTPFPNAGTSDLSATAPVAIGSFSSAACGGLASTLVDSNGIDNVRLASARLRNIAPDATDYVGSFVLQIDSLTPVNGPKSLSIVIPVNISTTAATATTRNFTGCGLATQQNEPAIGSFSANLSGHHPTGSYNIWYNLATAGNAPVSASVTKGAGTYSKAIIQYTFVAERDGGDDDNLEVRFRRSDGAILSGGATQVRNEKFPYSFMAIDDNLPSSNTFYYQVQYRSTGDGFPYWYETNLTVNLSK